MAGQGKVWMERALPGVEAGGPIIGPNEREIGIIEKAIEKKEGKT